MSEKMAGRALVIIYGIGAAISLWLLQIHFRLALGAGSLSGSCSIFAIPGGSGCEDVAVSAFSQIGFIPLAGIALGYYVSQLLMRLWIRMNPQTRYEPLHVSHNLASLAVIVTFFMAGISLFVVQSFCLGCAGLWLVNLIAWPLSAFSIEGKLGSIISANWETIRPKQMNLLRGRVKQGFLVAGFATLAIGAAAGLLEKSESQRMSGDSANIVSRWDSAPAAFLPAEALAGERAKGASTETAVMTVVKFSDFQCPACQRAAQLFKPFYLRNKNKVRFVYRNFPLDGSCNPYTPNGGHYLACQIAVTSLCAAKQGKFYPFHDFIMDNQPQLSAAKIKEGVAALGLDSSALDACISSEATKEELTRDMNWADSVALRSTPTFIINGKRFEGGLTPDQWEELLEEFERRKKKI